MATHLNVRNGLITRLDTADHDIGNAMRQPFRENAAKPKDGNSPFNEAFSFTYDEYELLKKLKPELFDEQLDPKTRLDNWKRFANSSEGRMFRIR